LFPAAPPSTERRDAGSTIIEVLVALAVVAVVIAACAPSNAMLS
jgi:type II secretory pathway pseudopilin PulG